MAAIKANGGAASVWEAATTPVAKRGMLALVEREHRYSYLCGAYAGHVSYMPSIVSSVTRDGIVKEVRLAGQDWRLKRRDWRQITVDSASRIADPEAVAAKLVDENDRAIEYRDHREAVAAIKAAGGIRRAACPEIPYENGSRDGRKCWPRERRFQVSYNEQL